MSSAPPDQLSFGCVVLTMGNRAEQLARAVDSLLRQQGVTLDVVVGNGWEPVGLPPRVRGLVSPRRGADTKS